MIEYKGPSASEQHDFLDLAKRREFKQVRARVRSHTDYVHFQPAGRWSALHQAAEAGCERTMDSLLSAGASVNAVPFARSILPDGATVVNKTNSLQMAY